MEQPLEQALMVAVSVEELRRWWEENPESGKRAELVRNLMPEPSAALATARELLGESGSQFLLAASVEEALKNPNGKTMQVLLDKVFASKVQHSGSVAHTIDHRLVEAKKKVDRMTDLEAGEVVSNYVRKKQGGHFPLMDDAEIQEEEK